MHKTHKEWSLCSPLLNLFRVVGEQNNTNLQHQRPMSSTVTLCVERIMLKPLKVSFLNFFDQAKLIDSSSEPEQEATDISYFGLLHKPLLQGARILRLFLESLSLQFQLQDLHDG